MKNLKSIIKYILIFIGLIAILLGTFVATVKFIPREKIENNIKESLPYLESNTELIEVKPTREYSYLHVYADEILLNMMYCMDSNQPLKSVMEAKYYSDNAVLEDLPSLEKALENGGQGNQEYIRYWHGSTIIIRPLLIFFNINEIYHIFAIIMIILIATLFIILIKKKQYILIIATIIGYIMIAINYVPFCLEYVWTFLIMLVVSIIGILTKKHNILLKEMYTSLLNGNELVIGNRYHNIQKGAMKFWHRYLGTPILNKLINIKYKTKIKDVNCGLRGFEKEKIKKLNLKCQGMEFASEKIIKAIKSDLKISQVDINFYKDARKTNSHLHALRDGMRHLKVILSE